MIGRKQTNFIGNKYLTDITTEVTNRYQNAFSSKNLIIFAIVIRVNNPNGKIFAENYNQFLLYSGREQLIGHNSERNKI